jgi:autotransporter passenger strand-loop-strand repeat protein
VGTTVSSGQTVSITQSDSGATVQGGGILIIDGGGTETSATINPGGVEIVASGGTDFGATVGSGGSELVMAGGTAADAVIAGGTLEIADGGTLAGAVDFAASGTLQIDGAAMPAATVSGFGVGQTIDLAGVAYDGAGSATLAAGNVLQVSEGGQTYSLDLDPTQNYAGHGFALASDGHGGTTIVDPQSTFTVANETELDTAIRSIDVGGSNVGLSAYTININAPINPTGDLPTINLTSDLLAINLPRGSSAGRSPSLLIRGGGDAIDGGNGVGLGGYRGFFVYAGNVTIENLRIQSIVAQGGAGGGPTGSDGFVAAAGPGSAAGCSSPGSTSSTMRRSRPAAWSRSTT